MTRRKAHLHHQLAFCALIVFVSGIAFAHSRKGAPPASTELKRAAAGIRSLQAWYNPATGLYRTTGWWNSANAITVLARFAEASRSSKYDSVFSNTLTAAQTGADGAKGFINKYYDDEGWWALAWINAYDLTRDQRYLSMAESIFSNMTTGWDDVCSGGIWWNKDRHYKAAIANELFLSVAAHLANRDAANRKEYLTWANREWQWFAASGLINPQNLVNDGLGTSTSKTPDGACHNNGLTTWSYNQGVILGGLVELSRLNADPSLPRAAEKIATAATTLLADRNGILHDPCEPKCGADGVQFKGIFVRNLGMLQLAYPDPQYSAFIVKNADSIWKAAQGPGHLFGEVWSGPFSGANAGTQSSALDALVAAVKIAMAPAPHS